LFIQRPSPELNTSAVAGLRASQSEKEEGMGKVNEKSATSCAAFFREAPKRPDWPRLNIMNNNQISAFVQAKHYLKEK
jgi:hypothetical protein